jgi:hypothetical protein
LEWRLPRSPSWDRQEPPVIVEDYLRRPSRSISV